MLGWWGSLFSQRESRGLSPASITDEMMLAIEQRDQRRLEEIIDSQLPDNIDKIPETRQAIMGKKWYSHMDDYDREDDILTIVIRRSKNEEEALRNIQFCLENGAEPNGTYSHNAFKHNQEPLSEALNRDYPKVFQYLVDLKAIQLKPKTSADFLREATRCGRLEIAAIILNKLNKEVSPVRSGAFGDAIRTANKPFIDLFLKHGARADTLLEVNVYDQQKKCSRKMKMTPLSFAVRSSVLLDGDSKRPSLEIGPSIYLTRCLLSQGADLRRPDSSGKTPLAWICELPNVRDRDDMLLALIRYDHITDLSIKVDSDHTLREKLAERPPQSSQLRQAMAGISNNRFTFFISDFFAPSSRSVSQKQNPLEMVQDLLQQEDAEYKAKYEAMDSSTDAVLTKRCKIELLKQMASHLEQGEELPSLDELLELARPQVSTKITIDDMRTRVLAGILSHRLRDLLADLHISIEPSQGMSPAGLR